MWLDCDPGHDDAFAMVLALHTPGVKVLGISTCGGNQTVEKVTANALNMLHVLNRDDVPVYVGQEHALMDACVPCPEIHGDSGLDTHCGIKFPTHSLAPAPGKAVVAMAEAILAAPRKVTLVATGRLTNVALLCTLYPEALRNIRLISIMGGAARGGNTHPVAEFNIQGDPEAAQIILNHAMSGADPIAAHAGKDWTTVPTGDLRVPVAFVPLEVTHTVLVTKEVLSGLQARCLAPPPAADAAGAAAYAEAVKQISAGTPVGSDSVALTPWGKLVTSLLLFFGETYSTHFGFTHGPPLHDPAAVLYALRPELFTAPPRRVDVECARSFGRGQTVVDIWRQSGHPPNTIFCEAVDVKALWEALGNAVAAVNEVTILNK